MVTREGRSEDSGFPEPPFPSKEEPSKETGDQTTSGADLARQALAQAKADARRRGAFPGGAGQGGSSRRDARSQGRRQGSAGGRVPGRDPQLLGNAIHELVEDRGWELPTAVAGVFARWPDIVGEELAAHTRPESFDNGELVVVADSSAWATQLRLLSGTLTRRLRAELGENAVDGVKVRGPTRSHGDKDGRTGRIPGPRG